MNNKARLKDYEKSANEYWRWVQTGNDMLIAALFLSNHYSGAIQELSEQKLAKFPLGYQVHAPMLYLKAKALENYLKALYIKQGKKVTNGNGKFTYKTHNLIKLSKNVGLDLNNSQTALLTKLSNTITFWGTYPIPVNYVDWRPNVEGIKGIQPIYTWGESDNTIFEKLLEKIVSTVDVTKDKNLPWFNK